MTHRMDNSVVGARVHFLLAMGRDRHAARLFNDVHAQFPVSREAFDVDVDIPPQVLGDDLEGVVQVVTDTGLIDNMFDVGLHVLVLAKEVIFEAVELFAVLGADVGCPGREGRAVVFDAVGDPADGVECSYSLSLSSPNPS